MSINPPKSEWLVEYMRQVLRAASVGMPRRYPIEPLRCVHLFAGRLALDWLETIGTLRGKGLSIPEIGALVGAPTQFTRAIPPAIHQGLKSIGVSLEEIRNAIMLMLELASSTKWGDVFNRNGRNLVLSPESVASLMSRQEIWSHADLTQSERVHVLCGLLRGFTELAYFAQPELGVETHGLYPLDGDSFLLIRSYRNLLPIDLWSVPNPISYDNIEILTVYKGISLEISFLGNIVWSDGNALDNLTTYCVLANGAALPLSEIDKISSEVSSASEQLLYFTQEMDEQALLLQYALIMWYALKPLRAASGQDWRPRTEDLAQLRSTALLPKFEGKLPLEMARQAFDLGIDY